jgi:hypothetical protein
MKIKAYDSGVHNIMDDDEKEVLKTFNSLQEVEDFVWNEINDVQDALVKHRQALQDLEVDRKAWYRLLGGVKAHQQEEQKATS